MGGAHVLCLTIAYTCTNAEQLLCTAHESHYHCFVCKFYDHYVNK